MANEHTTLDQATTGYNNLGSWTYGYDAASNPLSATHAGHKMDELESTQDYGYDTLNRLITARPTETQDWTAGAEKTTWYSYDDLGNRISHQYRDVAAIGYEHDKANRMTKLADKTQQYDKAGNLTLAFSADRGTSYTYTYDHHNRLIEVEETSSSTRKAAPGIIGTATVFVDVSALAR